MARAGGVLDGEAAVSWCRLNTHQAENVPDPGSTRIRDEQLYRQEGFKSFEAYCRQRLDISRARAYQLLSAVAVVSTMVDRSLPPPTVERHARELAKLDDPEQQAKALHPCPSGARDGHGGDDAGFPHDSDVVCTVQIAPRPRARGAPSPVRSPGLHAVTGIRYSAGRESMMANCMRSHAFCRSVRRFGM